MSEPIKIKAPRTEKQIAALEKARARANDIRLQKAEGNNDAEQRRLNAMNSRSTRLQIQEFRF